MLVVRGGAGIGKSSLLGAAAEEAAGRDMETLSLTAVPAESHLPFAAAHAMLGLLGGAVPPPVAGGHEHYRSQLALALLAAATARSTRRPLLLLVDDAQWVDAPSWEALSFIGRRLSADPVALILAMRDGAETDSRLAGLPVDELRVGPLPDEASAVLLDKCAPGLAPPLRDRVLAEAVGNPLALTELAGAAARIGERGLLPVTLPLTPRLPGTVASLPARLDWARGRTPDVPGRAPQVRAVSRCRPARDGVSGDFADMFRIAGGGWGAVIGDVRGKGADAAAVAAVVCRAVRAAGRVTAPRDVLETLNAAMLSKEVNREQFLTAVYVELRPATSGAHATVCSAGHPPVVLVRADGTVCQLGAGGIALGVTADPRLDERHVLLGHGDTMLLYTDGVTEARRDGECFGETRLHRLLARIGRWELAAVAKLVEHAALQFSRPDECDDIAVLVLRVE